jgi:hypothetical protein
MRNLLVTNRSAISAITTRQHFANSGGTLRGSHWGDFHPADLGRLPKEYRELFAQDAYAGRYVVYSYSTPIAWCDTFNDHWEVPPINYSVTTRKHVALVMAAIKHETELQARLGYPVSTVN